MERLANDALAILQIAGNGMLAGHSPSDLTILLGEHGVLRVIVESEWPLHSLQREYGARSAFRVRSDRGGVRVEGRDLCRRVEFRTSADPSQPEALLLPPALAIASG